MATASEMRKQAVAYMKSRTKKNGYTQGGKRTYFFGYPDNVPGNTSQNGYSDCSAAVRAAIKAATGIDIGANTSAQINNRNKKGIVVHETEGNYPDESKLLPGDCLYFKGNTSHPLDVGHVEMYTGPNECYGHGSGTGPTKKNLKTYCRGRAGKRRYFMAIRWIKDDDSGAGNASGNTEKTEYKGKGIGTAAAKMSMNIRSGASVDYSPIATIKKGTVVEVLEILNTGWYKIVWPGASCGYAYTSNVGGRYFTYKANTGSPRKVRIVNGNCNVRTAPNTNGRILGVAKKGQTFEYQGQTAENGWNLIEFENQNAWVSGNYSELEG